jgi:hypothetical protein
VEALAPGERLPSDTDRPTDSLSALVTRDSMRQTPDDRVPAELDSDEEEESSAGDAIPRPEVRLALHWFDIREHERATAHPAQ